MLNVTYVRAALVATILTSLTFISAAQPALFTRHDVIGPGAQIPTTFAEPGAERLNTAVKAEVSPVSPDSLSSTSTYYSLRTDLRRCVSPLCGGYFVKRVNLSSTRCANGRYMAECYVAEIDWNGQPAVEQGHPALLRGSLAEKVYGNFGKLGVLRVTESWQAASDNTPTGSFYRVKDRGLRCVTFPCPTHYEAKLNSTVGRDIAGVDLNSASATDNISAEASAAMTSADGILVAAEHVRVKGPAGRAETLKASQFYVRATQSVSVSNKPCIKTGCSSQVCSDEGVMTTCEWREEYACYKKAKCERQADGACGFTRTPELTSCLAGKRPPRKN